MAKAFYTQDEAKAALGLDEEGLKQLTREGRLTEYRDGAKLMYKGSQLEQLKAEVNPSGAGGPGDSGVIGLSDSSGGSGMISLADSTGPGASRSGSMADSLGGSVGGGSVAGGSMAGRSGSLGGIGMADEDTASGSMNLGDTGNYDLGGTGIDLDASATGSGITIFGEEDSDPSARTAINAPADQVNLEGIGSGSGLLDLTQEPDDTSFGAETFDEIMPGESAAGGTAIAVPAVDTGGTPAATRRGAPAAAGAYAEPYDPNADAFGFAALGAALFALLGLAGIAAAALNTKLGLLDFLTSEAGEPMSLFIVAGIGAGVAIVLGLIGLFVGRRG